MPPQKTNRGAKTEAEDAKKTQSAKKNSKAASSPKRNSNYLNILIVISVSICLVIAWTLLSWRTLDEQKEQPDEPLDIRPVAHTSSTTENLLAVFSKEHNDNLRWGTFRPGILFGVKSRTFPESIVAGIMWSTVSSKGNTINAGKMRHTCEESDTKEGLKFGYSEHTGADYGKQNIVDPVHNVKMETIFVKRHINSWIMRIAGRTDVSLSGKPKGRAQVFYFYLGVDNEFSSDSSLGAKLEIEHHGRDGRPCVIKGNSKELGRFRLIAIPSAGSVQATSGHDIISRSLPENTPIVSIKDVLLQQLKGEDGGSKASKASLLQPDPASELKSSIVVLQMVVESEFEIDFVFGDIDDDSPYLTEGANSELWQAEKKGYADLIASSSKSFSEKFEQVFQLRKSGRFDENQIEFAQSATSAMLGGLGYFYGQSKVKVREQESWLPPRGLFSAVPSRSFFPRGFLWDEGFHQLLIGRWDPALAKDAISHWFGLMHADGWIPREQILGAEALAKVPDWAVAQHRTHANPPTLLLAIESLLHHALDTDKATMQWLESIFPALEQWFAWFKSTQAGPEPGTFRWRGRNANDGKLNAMTLSSGLDDYPRASKVSDKEKHVDLYSWIAHGAGVLARIGERVGLPQDKITEYRSLHEDMIASLDKFHWDEKRKRYCDFGLHANQGEYARHIVVKCGTQDGSSSVEHAIAPKLWQQLQEGRTSTPPCPPEHPKFMFPLGDGQGGLMTRELYVPKDEKMQFVDHTGYVSLFPLFLRLIPADSPKLGDVLKTLGDEKRGLWSDFGLRSLAPNDKMYLRENAPGDAPYWRGPIWINCNFLAIHALRHYAAIDGPYRATAAQLLESLSKNLVSNIYSNYADTGFLWEQYNPKTGKGQRTHPFNGWSSLVVLMMS